jgi:hypothetical protein
LAFRAIVADDVDAWVPDIRWVNVTWMGGGEEDEEEEEEVTVSFETQVRR